VQEMRVVSRSRLSGAGSKPPRAAMVKSCDGERPGKVALKDRGRHRWVLQTLDRVKRAAEMGRLINVGCGEGDIDCDRRECRSAIWRIYSPYLP
jgi:hypothetical protein